MPIQKIFVTGDSFGAGAGLASESLFPSEHIFAERFTYDEFQRFYTEHGGVVEQTRRLCSEKIPKDNAHLVLEAEEKKRSYSSVIEALTSIPTYNISTSGGSLQSIAYNVIDKMSDEDNLENTLLIVNLTSIYRQMVPRIPDGYSNIIPSWRNTNTPVNIEEFYNTHCTPRYYAITALMAIKSIQHFALKNKMQCYYIDSYLYENSIQLLLCENGKHIKEIIEQFPSPDLLVYPGLVSREDKVWLPCGHHDHTVQFKIANKVIEDLSLV